MIALTTMDLTKLFICVCIFLPILINLVRVFQNYRLDFKRIAIPHPDSIQSGNAKNGEIPMLFKRKK